MHEGLQLEPHANLKSSSKTFVVCLNPSRLLTTEGPLPRSSACAHIHTCAPARGSRWVPADQARGEEAASVTPTAAGR